MRYFANFLAWNFGPGWLGDRLAFKQQKRTPQDNKGYLGVFMTIPRTHVAVVLRFDALYLENLYLSTETEIPFQGAGSFRFGIKDRN